MTCDMRQINHRNQQKHMKTDRKGQKWAEIARNGQKQREADHCIIVTCRVTYKQQALSNSRTRKVD